MEAASPQPDAIAKIQNRWHELKQQRDDGTVVDSDAATAEIFQLAVKAGIERMQLFEILYSNKEEQI